MVEESYEAITVDFGILGGSRTHRTRILSAVHMPILLRGHKVVPLARLEPARSCEQQILSLLCLPFHHSGIYATVTAVAALECQMGFGPTLINRFGGPAPSTTRRLAHTLFISKQLNIFSVIFLLFSILLKIF